MQEDVTGVVNDDHKEEPKAPTPPIIPNTNTNEIEENVRIAVRLELLQNMHNANAQWKFKKFSHDKNSNSKNSNILKNSQTPKHKLLIAQYVGNKSQYKSMLDASEVSNAGYAELWGHDYVRVDGPILGPGKELFAPFGKIPLIEYAIHQGIYDAVMVLDADACVSEFDRDVTELLSDDIFLTGLTCSADDDVLINNGLTLWNLHHKNAAQTLAAWK
jgi:hypothetical protein